jgi:hypothetical protein
MHRLDPGRLHGQRSTGAAVSIDLTVGQPGHGKSYRAVRLIRDALESGMFVVSNINLLDLRTQAEVDAGEPPTWAMTMAKTNWFRRVIPGRARKVAERNASRFVHADDLTQLRRYRLPACGKCQGCRRGPGCQKENRGLAVLDEAHQWLNARTWDADETGQTSTKAEAVRRRLDIIKFFATHRHFGWKIVLITQDEANLDRQVRGLFEVMTHLKNLRRYKVLGLFPIVPFNVFVAVTHWHDNDKSRLGVETYLLNKKLARCYDTFGAARDLEDAPDAIWLGPRSATRARRAGEAPPAPAENGVDPATPGAAPPAPPPEGDGRETSADARASHPEGGRSPRAQPLTARAGALAVESVGQPHDATSPLGGGSRPAGAKAYASVLRSPLTTDDPAVASQAVPTAKSDVAALNSRREA